MRGTRSRDGRRGVFVTGAVVVVLILAVVAVDAATANTGDTVVVLGDSITATSGKQFAKRLTDYRVTLRATPGSTAQDMVPTAQSVAGVRPRQLVIDLGSNDALRQVPLEQTQAAFEQLLKLFPDAACVHVVNVSTRMRSDGAARAEPARAINEMVQRLAERDDRIRVIDWDATVGGDPGLVYDTIHPTPEGQDLLADEVAGALSRCGRPWRFW